MTSAENAKLDSFSSFLRKKDLKSTQQRHVIAATFFSITTHINLEELLKKVKKKNPNVGFATVYRTMKLLLEGGLAVERHFGDGQTRYENVPEDGHHDHLICVKCSDIVEFTNQKIEKLQEETARKHDFKVVRHKLELYGYCRKCR
ncbi:MAG: transcriptional repressor [Deltaproteobacteria bacterium]|nr:transcriptional repressor [Deltaproteobacteria bacterium]